MGIEKIVFGRELPLFLQLGNSASNRFPQAQIFDKSGTVLNTINLTHIAGSDGLYKGDSVLTMPNEDFIVVQYTVFQNSSRTNISAQHDSSTDTFLRNNVPPSGEIRVIVDPTDSVVVQVEDEPDTIVTIPSTDDTRVVVDPEPSTTVEVADEPVIVVEVEE